MNNVDSCLTIRAGVSVKWITLEKTIVSDFLCDAILPEIFNKNYITENYHVIDDYGTIHI